MNFIKRWINGSLKLLFVWQHQAFYGVTGNRIVLLLACVNAPTYTSHAKHLNFVGKEQNGNKTKLGKSSYNTPLNHAKFLCHQVFFVFLERSFAFFGFSAKVLKTFWWQKKMKKYPS